MDCYYGRPESTKRLHLICTVNIYVIFSSSVSKLSIKVDRNVSSKFFATEFYRIMHKTNKRFVFKLSLRDYNNNFKCNFKNIVMSLGSDFSFCSWRGGPTLFTGSCSQLVLYIKLSYWTSIIQRRYRTALFRTTNGHRNFKLASNQRQFQFVEQERNKIDSETFKAIQLFLIFQMELVLDNALHLLLFKAIKTFRVKLIHWNKCHRWTYGNLLRK